MRVIGTLPRTFRDDVDIDIEKLEEIIKTTTKIELDFTERGWNSIYRLHHRAVSQFSRGNIFLAGDAAHIHSPAGGQGMNTGLQDAHNLAWKIAMVIHQYFSQKLLQTYNEERLPIARQLLDFTDNGFTYLAGDKFWIRKVRRYVLIPILSKLLKNIKFRRIAFKRISQIDYSYHSQSLAKSATHQKLKFKSGDRMPYIESHFYTKFNAPEFYVIYISNNPRKLEVHFAFPTKIVHLPLDEKWSKLGVSSDLFMILRPDQHILWLGDEIHEAEIMNPEYQFKNNFEPYLH